MTTAQTSIATQHRAFRLVAVVLASACISAAMLINGARANEQPAEWQAVRDALTGPTCGFEKRPEYCIRDPEFLDPIIARLLTRFYQGALPKEQSKLEELIAYAQTDLAAALTTAEGLNRLEVLLHARYKAPRYSLEGNTAIADYGFAPGKPSLGPRGQIGVSHSAELHQNAWHSQAAAAALAALHRRYPQATQLEARLWIADKERTRWTYRYDAQRKQVTVFNSGQVNGSYVGDGSIDEFVNGQKRLAITELRLMRGRPM